MSAETVTHITRTPGEPDRYGKPTLVETETPIDGVGVAPTSSETDPETGLVIAQRGMILYLPSTVHASADDSFIVRGITYKVDGASKDWVSMFEDWAPGNVVVLKEAEFIDVEN